ncbi:MAG: hypothetical protein OMM_04682 [Candidatus Magnetoglobus multicellularis str. Araruama]|uniref:Uncharacterized protein n=1 Tax=Candidatus Magnetoglobus multicellularis str. Araruama TaxID=890399 RepID=A0A1V1P036_9BACT|nr:MAG: hypothetical protein OMM_04682 [Candidatus Magnetoglobus multicellularis str. Araruama]
MENNDEINGLKLTKLYSKVTIFNDIKLNELKTNIFNIIHNKSFIAAWLDHKVLIDKFSPEDSNFFNKQSFDFKYIKQMRIFNEDQEFLVWRVKKDFKARLRKDSFDEIQDAEKTIVVIAKQALFGTDFDEEFKDNNYSKIKEARGTELILPFNKEKINKLDNDFNRIFIKTYNYIIDKTEKTQASYVDCRFVKFVDSTNNSLY